MFLVSPTSLNVCASPLTLWQVREEQQRLRPDPKVKITGEVLGEMAYTRQVGAWPCSCASRP